MSYRLRVGEDVEQTLRRVADEQLRKALDELRAEAGGPAEAVHQVRKRCKKLRALLRLYRGGLGDTRKRENAALRDAAKRLSALRDARARVESCAALEEHLEETGVSALLVELRETLELRAAALEQAPETPAVLASVGAELERVAERAARWTLDEQGFDALRKGLARTARRARKAFAEARDDPTTERLHEWRKRVKDHGFHLKLLRPLWPRVVKAHRAEVDELAELLGDDHDLAVLTGVLGETDVATLGDREARDVLRAVLARRRRDLQRRAVALGRRVHASRPRAFVDRLEDWWDAWIAEGGAPD